MVVGRQICTKGLIEISTETGNTVFPEDSIGTDELAHVLRRYIAEEFLRHSAGSNHPGSECKHAGRTVRAGKKIQAGVLGNGENIFVTTAFLTHKTDGSAIL